MLRWLNLAEDCSPECRLPRYWRHACLVPVRPRRRTSQWVRFLARHGIVGTAAGSAYGQRQLSCDDRPDGAWNLPQPSPSADGIVAQQLVRERSDSPRGLVLSLTRVADEVVQDVRAPLLILFGAVGLLLLTACANICLPLDGDHMNHRLGLFLGSGGTAGERSPSRGGFFRPPPLVSGAGFLSAALLVLATHSPGVRSRDAGRTGSPSPTILAWECGRFSPTLREEGK